MHRRTLWYVFPPVTHSDDTEPSLAGSARQDVHQEDPAHPSFRGAARPRPCGGDGVWSAGASGCRMTRARSFARKTKTPWKRVRAGLAKGGRDPWQELVDELLACPDEAGEAIVEGALEVLAVGAVVVLREATCGDGPAGTVSPRHLRAEQKQAVAVRGPPCASPRGSHAAHPPRAREVPPKANARA
jgi:hypothetical protein